MRTTSIIWKVDVFQGLWESLCLQGIDETWFRIVFSPVYEYFLSNTDDGREVIPLGGMMLLPLNTEENKITINWEILQRWLKYGLQAWTLKHIRDAIIITLWKWSHVLITVIETHKADFLEKRQVLWNNNNNNFLSIPQNVQKEKVEKKSHLHINSKGLINQKQYK